MKTKAATYSETCIPRELQSFYQRHVSEGPPTPASTPVKAGATPAGTPVASPPGTPRDTHSVTDPGTVDNDIHPAADSQPRHNAWGVPSPNAGAEK